MTKVTKKESFVKVKFLPARLIFWHNTLGTIFGKRGSGVIFFVCVLGTSIVKKRLEIFKDNVWVDNMYPGTVSLVFSKMLGPNEQIKMNSFFEPAY